MTIKTLEELQNYINDITKKHKITHYQIDGINILDLNTQISRLDKSKGESVIFYPIILDEREHEVGIATVIFVEEKAFLKREINIEV